MIRHGVGGLSKKTLRRRQAAWNSPAAAATQRARVHSCSHLLRLFISSWRLLFAGYPKLGSLDGLKLPM